MADDIKILQEIANEIREGNRDRQIDNQDANNALEDIAKSIDVSGPSQLTSEQMSAALQKGVSGFNDEIKKINDERKELADQESSLLEEMAANEQLLAGAVETGNQKLIDSLKEIQEENLNALGEIQAASSQKLDQGKELEEIRDLKKSQMTGLEKLANAFQPEETVQEDPNQDPSWVDKLLGENKEYYDKSIELTGMLGEKFSNFGNKIADGLSSLPGVDAAKNFFGAIKDLAVKVLMLVGGFTALKGFLDGLENASKWFGDDANFKEIFASGLAGIAQAFGIVNEEEAKAIAETLVGIFDWMQDTFMWMFNGVKDFAIGVKDFISKLGGIGDQFASGDILGGLSSLWDTITEDLLGNISMGAVAAFALLAPKLTLSIVSFGVKALLPKVVGLLSGAFGPALASIGSAAAGAMSTLVAGIGSAFTAMSAAISTTLIPLAIAAAPFIAAAAAIALVIKGIYDGFMEGMAIFEETGSVVEGLKAGISKMFGTIIGFIPDLLKDIVSWAARSLGFESFADDLDSFSFTDAITDAFRNVYNWFEKFPLMLKKGIYSLLNKIPGFRGDFDEDIAGLDQQIAEKDAKADETKRIIEEKRAAEKEAERLEKEKEATEEEKLESQEMPEALPPEAPTQIVNQTMTIDSKPISEGLKRIEDAINKYFEALDVEMQNSKGGGVAVSNVNNHKTVNQSTVAISTQLSHRNIGATRGMFGAPIMPLSNPNAT